MVKGFKKVSLIVFGLLFLMLTGCEAPIGLGQSLDLEAPRIYVTSHKNLDFISPNFTIRGKATDNFAVTEVVITASFNNTVVTRSTGVAANGAWDVDFQGLSDGEYEFSALAKDQAGNSSKDSRFTLTMTVDSTPPVVTLSQPVLKTVAELTTLDSDNFENITFFKNQSFQIKGTVDENFKAASVKIELLDTLGATAFTRTISENAPLPPGVTGSIYSFTVTVSVPELTGATLALNQKNYYQVRTTAIDRAGNQTPQPQEYVCIFPDKDKPWIQITSNLPGDTVGAGGMISGNGYDDDGISKIYAAIVPALRTVTPSEYLTWGTLSNSATATYKVIDKSTDAPSIFTWSLKAPTASGAYKAYVLIFDKNNLASEQYTTLDFIVPDVDIPTITISNPGENGLTVKDSPNQSFTFQGTWADNSGAISSVEVLWLQGGVKKPATVTLGNWTLSSADFGLTAGAQNFEITATDLEGNQGRTSRYLFIDTDVTPPTVNSVSSTTTNPASNNHFTVGSIITAKVLFSEPVVVTGIPELTLNVGAGRKAIYTYGDQTNSLTFNYEVVPGDTSGALDYSSIAALTLAPGVSIKDRSGNNAVLTLSAPGSLTSISGTSTLVIDTTAPLAPVINEVSNTSFSITGIEAQAKVEYSLNNGNWTIYPGSAVSFPMAASTQIASRQRDQAGNQSNPSLATITNDINKASALSVSSLAANGVYTIGQVIPVTVDFSRNVVVSGTPRLSLETGAVDRLVNYSSGSGTSRLTFLYTVQPGDSAPRLDYTTTTALTLNGGSIMDTRPTGAEAAILTLPSPAAALSLGNNKAIEIDTLQPWVTGVTSLAPNGYYQAGGSIPITISFSEPVTVSGGNLLLTLETGAVDALVAYTSGSGTTTLTFTYLVSSGQNSNKLEYVSTSALDLAGASLKDLAGNNATLTLPSPSTPGSLGGSKNFIVDTTPAMVTTVTSSSPNGFYNTGKSLSISVSFSETVIVSGTPSLMMNTGGINARYAYYAYGSGTNTLTFTYLVQTGDTANPLDYFSTSALSGSIQDLASNPITAILPTVGGPGSLGGQKNLVIITTAPLAPVISGLTSGYFKLAQSFSLGGAPGASFEYTLDGGATWAHYSAPVTVSTEGTYYIQARQTDPALNTSPVTEMTRIVIDKTAPFAPQISGIASGNYNVSQSFTLSGELGAQLEYSLNGGNTWTSYPGTGITLATPATYQILARQTDQAGNLSVTTGLVTIVINTTRPTISSITSETANGYYNLNKVIVIKVNFMAPVYVTGSPVLTLNSSSINKASFLYGSGTTALSFTYAVAAGDTSTDLDIAAQTSLDLNSGAIRDIVGNDAILTLPVPGSISSLGGQKAIVIDTSNPAPPAMTGISEGIYNTTQNITLTGEVGATFQYSMDNGNNWSTYVGPTSISIGGNYYLTSRQIDQAGNISVNGATTNFTIDKIQPIVVNVSSNIPNGEYKEGDTLEIRVDFSKPILVNITAGTPTLNLNTNPGSTASFTNASGNTAIFSYTIAAGEFSPDLDYANSGAMSLNGATIKDTSGTGNNANLNLFTTGTSGSLGSNKNLKVDAVDPTLSSISPANNAQGVNAASSIILNFSEPVYRENGIIKLTRTYKRFPVLMTLAQRNEFWSRMNQTNKTLLESSYTLITNGADTTGQPNTGGIYVLNYDIDPPTGITAPGGTAGLLWDAFDLIGYNQIEIPVDSTQVTGSGTTTITINPSSDLAIGVHWYVEIPATAFRDSVRNSYKGLSGTSAYTFVTGPVATPVIRVNKTSGNGQTQPTTTSMKISIETQGASLFYGLGDNGGNAPAGVVTTGTLNAPITLGDGTFSGNKIWIQARGSLPGLGDSGTAHEKAFKTVLIGNNANQSGNQTWFRGSNNTGGPTSAPGFPIAWETNLYDKIRLSNTNRQWATWEINVKTYFKAISGFAGSYPLGPNGYRWQEGANNIVNAGEAKTTGTDNWESGWYTIR